MNQSNLSKEELIYKRIDTYKEIVTGDRYRMHYHLMPPIGLLNDPNGFIFFKGQYHIFYQWNPLETAHGSKYWGHYISDDLVHWEQAPIAISPDQWFDKDGCYSGSAVVKDEKMYLFYTGNVKDNTNTRESYQCMAVSKDGIHFEKKGPVIYVPKGYTAHFRDPKVFYKDDRWYMVIGAQSTDGMGHVVLYSSANLENWEFIGPIAGSNSNGLGDFGYMWECPDMFELEGNDILVFSPQGIEPDGYKYNNIYQSGYFSGEADFQNGTYDHGEFNELDRGFDFYAPQTTCDGLGRRLLFGWMGNAEEDGVIHPTAKNHWIHALTIPRRLNWKNGQLLQNPVQELTRLRENEVAYNAVTIHKQDTKLPAMDGNVFELKITIKEWQATSFSIHVGSSRISFDQNNNTFTFERKRLAAGEIFESRHCHLNELKCIQLFKDTSSIEIFINEGEEVFSSRIFDTTFDSDITFSVEGNVTADVQKWDLKKVCS